MREALASRWSSLALRGALAVLFGILALAWPGATVVTLVLLFGILALGDGVISGVMAFSHEPPRARWMLGLEAALGVVVGILALTRPGITAAAVVTYIGIWALIVGALKIGHAISLRKAEGSQWLLVASGALTILVGLLVISRPVAGIVGLAWAIGVLAIAFGIAEITLAMRLRKLPTREEARGRVWSMRAEEHPEAARDRIER